MKSYHGWKDFSHAFGQLTAMFRPRELHCSFNRPVSANEKGGTSRPGIPAFPGSWSINRCIRFVPPARQLLRRH
jgi:hypothetical protein